MLLDSWRETELPRSKCTPTKSMSYNLQYSRTIGIREEEGKVLARKE